MTSDSPSIKVYVMLQFFLTKDYSVCQGNYLNRLFINLLDCGILPRLRLFFGDVSPTSSQVTFLTAGGDLWELIWFSGDSNIFLLTVCKFLVQQHISTKNKICPKTSSVAHTQRGNKYQFDISIYK